MTYYLQKFSPRLSEITTPLREVTKNDNEFLWDDQVHGAALEETKKILSTTPVLKYFDPGATPTLQCDASMHGLGACLMQDGHPVAYASRSLSPTEVQYVQIEKELLAIVSQWRSLKPNCMVGKCWLNLTTSLWKRSSRKAFKRNKKATMHAS